MKEIGPQFGYYPEPKKTWLVAEPQKAHILFGNKMKVTSKSHRYLGTAVGISIFKNGLANSNYVQKEQP